MNVKQSKDTIIFSQWNMASFQSSIKDRISCLFRKKKLEIDVLSTPLNRCLDLFDLVLIGIGVILGPAIFTITGPVLRNVAGPAVWVCFLQAGVVAMISALCYAEFAALLPKAGSAYA